MPELPEVEVVRRGITQNLLNSTIHSVEVLDPRSLRRHFGGTHDFSARLAGCSVVDVARRGKYLWLLLRDTSGDLLDEALVVHLGMSGQILLKTADFPDEKHLKIRCVVRRPGGEMIQLRFVDQRIFGGMFLSPLIAVHDESGKLTPASAASTLAEPLIPQSVAHIARDPLDPYFSEQEFRAKLRKTSSGIKRLLLDQSVISGVGNIYADEALWFAKLHYAKPAHRLTLPQTRTLLEGIRQVMGQALEAGGTSFDALYVNVNGESGYFDRSLNAYGQAGKPCRRCAKLGRTSMIVREPFMNRSSFRCPYCQRAPAD